MSAAPDVIDKIKKLLRLARSSNAHEAQLALQRALALAAEHRVAIEGLNPDELAAEKKVTHRDSPKFGALTYDKRYAISIVKTFFRVSVVEVSCIHVVDGWPRAGVKLMFVGTSSDIEIALYVYGFLVSHFSYCWNHHRGRVRNRRAYIHGMFVGLYSKLLEQNPATEREANGSELVLADQKAYITAVLGKTEQRGMRLPEHEAHAATMAGYAQGQQTEIRTALKPAERQLQLQ